MRYCSLDENVKLCRLTLLGTGTPNVNKAQVASSYLVELGDGQVFLFDVGTDSFQNLIATGIDRGRINKVCGHVYAIDVLKGLQLLWMLDSSLEQSSPLACGIFANV